MTYDFAKYKDEFDKIIFNYFSVLGIDIYQYSKYPPHIQTFIPIIFDKIYTQTIDDCFQYEPLLFSKEVSNQTKETLKTNYFISTGDGGFQIFRTPIHALSFLIYFQKNIHSFNVHSFLPNYHAGCGELSIRYAITYDYLYAYKNNFYGQAIIKNARILSKDRLNRSLIDKETYTWFENKCNGIESLSMIKNKNSYGHSLKKLFGLGDDVQAKSYLFGDENKISTSICQRLTDINIKNSSYFIYNLYIQVIIEIAKIQGKGFVVPIGNLNLTGLDE